MKVLIFVALSFVLISAKSHKEYQVFKLTKLNWYAAFVDCLSRGQQLATIDSADDQVALETAMKEANVMKEWLWTSGTDQNEEGNFVWMSTGKPIVYSKWSSGQPDNAGKKENCLHVWPVGNTEITWNDWQCWNKLYYVCQNKPPCIPDLDVRIFT